MILQTRGGAREGAGRHKKYNPKECSIIGNICEKVWQTRKNKKNNFIFVTLINDPYTKYNYKIWDANIKEKLDQKKINVNLKLPITSHNRLKLINRLQDNGNKKKSCIYKKPTNKDESLKISILIISQLMPEKFHRISMIESIWKKNKNISN